MDAKLAAALAAGRDAQNRMAGAMSDDEYLNAASALADAFRTVDELLIAKPKNTRK